MKTLKKAGSTRRNGEDTLSFVSTRGSNDRESSSRSRSPHGIAIVWWSTIRLIWSRHASRTTTTTSTQSPPQRIRDDFSYVSCPRLSYGLPLAALPIAVCSTTLTTTTGSPLYLSSFTATTTKTLCKTSPRAMILKLFSGWVGLRVEFYGWNSTG